MLAADDPRRCADTDAREPPNRSRHSARVSVTPDGAGVACKAGRIGYRFDRTSVGMVAGRVCVRYSIRFTARRGGNVFSLFVLCISSTRSGRSLGRRRVYASCICPYRRDGRAHTPATGRPSPGTGRGGFGLGFLTLVLSRAVRPCRPRSYRAPAVGRVLG